MHENFGTLGRSANDARNKKQELDGCRGFGLWVGAAVEHNTNLTKLRCPFAMPRPPVPAAVPWVSVTHRTVTGTGRSMITALRKRLAQLEPARQTATLLALATPAPLVAALQPPHAVTLLPPTTPAPSSGPPGDPCPHPLLELCVCCYALQLLPPY
jgi:hypothetical protein